jgi:hypothetical protein
MNHLKLTIILVFIFVVALSAMSKEKIKVELDSPRNTIVTYFDYHEDKTIISKCFYPPQFNGKLEIFWISYNIIDEKKTEKTGRKTYSDIVITKDAVEITVEVEMKDLEKKNPKTKFWFLLQQFDGEWKIIEHSHIPDKNYPAYD